RMDGFGDFIASVREAVPKEWGGTKDKDGVVMNLASYIDSIHKKPGTEQFGFGAVAGLGTGYTYAKGNKIVKICLEQDLKGMTPLELEASKIGPFISSHGFLLIGFGVGAVLACVKSRSAL
ncbi:hypothetical protein PMAYCL1PPCAC_21982, partial [Pristionchus mayeri]